MASQYAEYGNLLDPLYIISAGTIQSHQYYKCCSATEDKDLGKERKYRRSKKREKNSPGVSEIWSSNDENGTISGDTLFTFSALDGFDVVQVWSRQSEDSLVCCLISYSDPFLSTYSSLIDSLKENSHRTEELLRRANQSRTGYIWHVLEDTAAAKQRIFSQDLMCPPYPFSTEMACAINDQEKLFMVAFSLKKIGYCAEIIDTLTLKVKSKLNLGNEMPKDSNGPLVMSQIDHDRARPTSSIKNFTVPTSATTALSANSSMTVLESSEQYNFPEQKDIGEAKSDFAKMQKTGQEKASNKEVERHTENWLPLAVCQDFTAENSQLELEEDRTVDTDLLLPLQLVDVGTARTLRMPQSRFDGENDIFLCGFSSDKDRDSPSSDELGFRARTQAAPGSAHDIQCTPAKASKMASTSAVSHAVVEPYHGTDSMTPDLVSIPVAINYGVNAALVFSQIASEEDCSPQELKIAPAVPIKDTEHTNTTDTDTSTNTETATAAFRRSSNSVNVLECAIKCTATDTAPDLPRDPTKDPSLSPLSLDPQLPWNDTEDLLSPVDDSKYFANALEELQPDLDLENESESDDDSLWMSQAPAGTVGARTVHPAGQTPEGATDAGQSRGGATVVHPTRPARADSRRRSSGSADGDSRHHLFRFPFDHIPKLPSGPLSDFDLSLENLQEMVHVANGSRSNIFTARFCGVAVVVKMIKEEFQCDEDVLKEFDIEFDILRRISHPNMVRIFGAGTIPRRFFVLEYLQGGTLSYILKSNEDKMASTSKLFRRPAFRFREVLAHARDLAGVLAYLHEHVFEGVCIIHRDLKPDNIAFGSTGTLKLLDFGLASCVRRRGALDQAYELTGGTGSMRYMAPEVALQQPYAEKVDVYSFAIVVWQMATNKVPFKDFDKSQFMTEVVGKGGRPKLSKRLPQELNSLLLSCWHSNWKCRPSFATVVNRLNEMIARLGRRYWICALSCTRGASAVELMQDGEFERSDSTVEDSIQLNHQAALTSGSYERLNKETPVRATAPHSIGGFTEKGAALHSFSAGADSYVDYDRDSGSDGDAITGYKGPV